MAIDKEKARIFDDNLNYAGRLLESVESILGEYDYTESMAHTVGCLIEQIRGLSLGVKVMQDPWMQEGAEVETDG